MSILILAIWSPVLAFYAFAAGAFYATAKHDYELCGLDNPRYRAFVECIVWPYWEIKFRGP